MFSSRLRQGQGRNALARALERRRAAGLPVTDLTESNPTKVGIPYPEGLLAGLSNPRGLCYEPTPFGLPEARRAIAGDFARRAVAVLPERVVLTASTSEAYSLLFKLLCNPGDSILAPRPSYPLVEHLAALDAVAVDFYSLEYHGRWTADLAGIRHMLERTPARAILSVSPNNPTGSALTGGELDELAKLAHAHDAALVVDEVFTDYPIETGPPPSALLQSHALTFALGGLSKTIGLPQAKLGWIGVSGPDSLVEQALEQLETICDAYLSVSTPIQLCAAELLKQGADVRRQIHDRVRANHRILRESAARYPACSVLAMEAGWYAVIQVPAVQDEEALVLNLLERAELLVHPGYFFDFEREAFLVVSLLPEPATFSLAVERLFGEIERTS